VLLGLLDYGARMYDPAIGRWTAQDLLAEEMYNLSPYRFSLNDLLFEAKLISKSKSIQYVNKGSYAKALIDFKTLNLRNIKEHCCPEKFLP